MEKLRRSCRMALWFTSSKIKCVALSKALASGSNEDLITAARRALNFVQSAKARKRLSEDLSNI